MFLRIVLTAVALVAPLSIAMAQAPRQLADQPMLILRSNTLNSRSVSEYMTSLGRDLQIGDGVVTAMSSQEGLEALPKHPNPVAGSLVYMVRGLIPSAEAIEFTQVADEADFERLVRLNQGSPDDSEVEGSDGKYKRTTTTTWTEDVADNEIDGSSEIRIGKSAAGSDESDAPKHKVTISLGAGPSSGNGIKVTSLDPSQNGEIIEKDGRRYRQHTATNVTYLRYHDDFMFTSSFEDLHNIPLPTRDLLLGRAESGLDAELDFFPDRIPVGFKHLFWNTISSTASTELQQIDGEDPVDYTLRRASGDVGLTVLQTLLFDTERITGQFSVATDQQPIRGELKLRSRENSNFAKDLGGLATARSRFAPMLNDDAALTVHTSLKLPEGPRKVLVAAGQWIRAKLMDAATTNVDLAIAGGELNRTLEGISVHGNLELLLKIGWTKPSGGVIYGGLQVDDNPALLKTVFNLLVSEDVDADLRDRFAMVEKNGVPMIEFQAPADSEGPIRISHVYLAHQNSCLWFAAGGVNSHDVLKQSIERCGAAGLLTKTALMTARVDFERWMTYPQDEPTGIAALPSAFDTTLTADSQKPVVIREDGAESPRVTPAKYSKDELLQAVVRMGGSRKASLIFDADPSGFVIRSEVGAAIGRYLLARVLASAEMAMNNVGTPQQVSSSPETHSEPEVK